MTSGDMNFHLSKKWPKKLMIFDALSNVAFRVSARGPGAELDGRCPNTPRHDEVGAEHRPGVG